MNKFINWLMVSSNNPQKLATTVKGILVGVIPMLLIALKFFGFEIGGGEAGVVIDGIENIIILGLGIVSSVMTLFGLVRKIIETARGNFNTTLGCWDKKI